MSGAYSDQGNRKSQTALLGIWITCGVVMMGLIILGFCCLFKCCRPVRRKIMDVVLRRSSNKEGLEAKDVEDPSIRGSGGGAAAAGDAVAMRSYGNRASLAKSSSKENIDGAVPVPTLASTAPPPAYNTQ